MASAMKQSAGKGNPVFIRHLLYARPQLNGFRQVISFHLTVSLSVRWVPDLPGRSLRKAYQCLITTPETTIMLYVTYDRKTHFKK